MENCVEILKPLQYMTTALSGEKYVTISTVIPLVRGLTVLKNLQPEISVTQNLRDCLLHAVTQRLIILEENMICVKATLLDALYKKNGIWSRNEC